MAGETKLQGRILRRTLRTKASPRQVWEAWTNGERLSGWFTDRAELDPKPGGKLKWVFEKMGRLELPGEFLEVEPERRVTWTWPPPPGHLPGIMEITITRDGDTTVMTMVQSGFAEDAKFDDEFEGMQSGWDLSFGVLKLYLEHHFGELRDSMMVLRPAAYDYATLAPYFHDAGRRHDWIGRRFDGEVLAATDREMAIAWPEMNGVFELKAFGGRGGKMLGVRVSGWNWPADRSAELERQFTPAVERLAAIFADGSIDS